MSDSVARNSVICKRDEEKRLVYGVVLEPDTFDLQNDVISTEEIEKAAHQYAIDCRVVGIQHEDVAQADVVESYLAPVDFKIGETEVKKGSWVMAVRINDEELWEAVKRDEFTGFSIHGFGERVPVND